MGLKDWIFPNKKEKNTTRFEMISDYGNGFYSFGGNLYKSDIIRSCIRPFSKAIGKLVAKHLLKNDKVFKVNPNVPIKFLLEEPNPLMSGQMLQEKIATQLKLNNNAFIYIKYDEFNFISELYPIPTTSVEAVQDGNGELYLKFLFMNGDYQTIPYKHIIHLRNDFNGNDIFGDSPKETLLPLMEVVNTIDQGIINAVKNSAVIKWILKFTAVLRPEDMKRAVKDFTTNYLNIDSEMGGAAAADGKYDIQQVKNESYVPNEKQISETIKRIYAYFGTNEKIVMSNYSEDEWNSYFEAEIQPFSMQLSNEYTRKIFSKRERGFGNKIIFEASSLQYASMSSKLGLVQFVDRGIMCANDVLEILNMPPIEGGDKYIRRLDTAVIDDTKSTEGGDDNGQEEG
ncbi:MULTISPECIES: phage portal protein [Bacillus cereus group]|uniref:HK97 family phage portal protein n=1 Tax=Bacillus thuringiensis TaxID=1428 RepID=A0A1C4FG97_BACTU|nr:MULTISPECIES: phage portal protein [Bacillus cereus group]MED3026152.1 phage portal protein [Bacillus wiedmannii]PDY73620.1 phage portal protein [Bacillus cereus]PGV06847.1 phage portal protein [Bacillus cereus]SCC55029.1 HK97 family phage portal protein [Bacillus thuringiensis]